MITHQEYMKAPNRGHRQYYRQFVDERVMQTVVDAFGVDRVKKWAILDKDSARKLIPLKEWDLLGLPLDIANRLRELGDTFTLSSCVCILKEAARQIGESETPNERKGGTQ